MTSSTLHLPRVSQRHGGAQGTAKDVIPDNPVRRNWSGWKFVGPYALLFAFVFITPVVYSLYLSIRQKKMIGGDQFVGLANYVKLVHDPHFWEAVGRILLYTAIQVPVMLVLAASLALALDSAKLYGTKFFRIGTFMPYAVPGVISALMWGFIYGTRYGMFGSLNNALGTNIDPLSQQGILAAMGNIGTWGFTGYNMLIFYAALSTIPHSLYEAAAIDGANEWQILWRIKLPELRGSLAISFIFAIIGAFQLFTEPMVLKPMAPAANITSYYTPNYYAYNLSFVGEQGNYAAAVAIIMALITMSVAYAVQFKGMKEQMR